ncbi:MAG: HNH homing endonuclease [uncultured Sulfurovum sp.]|uniref:HNH homing endonuclease n=1 Tax=uncultured Sulfurovum sp. TaxID=269237 RepID=A0A6S6SW61_9BACT|nr:MAG: HNH homing endonuclease [uncultured Sulfurovum sp.]
MKEIWKDIEGYEGLYKISNLGNVRSLDRVVTKSNNVVNRLKGKILKPAKNTSGYYNVIIYKNCKPKTYSNHQLVAMMFLNHKPDGFNIVVDHIDNNKLNNRLDNLQLITNRENVSKESRGKSKYTGVSWRKNRNKWISTICINGKRKHLGSFINEIDAHYAYQNKLKINNYE